jgi:hypothetical protein
MPNDPYRDSPNPSYRAFNYWLSRSDSKELLGSFINRIIQPGERLHSVVQANNELIVIFERMPQ